MAFEQHFENKDAFIFRLDDVLFPEKDYLLQVYYLFSEFMAYSEQLDSKEMLAFLQQEYSAHGADNLFQKWSKKYGVNEKYLDNFVRLHANARLPLKLLLFKQVLSFLQEIVVNRGSIFLILEGDPETQINKIKQTEWNGLETYLKLYFTSEFNHSLSATLDHIIAANQLRSERLLFIDKNGASAVDSGLNLNSTNYINVNKLLSD